MKRFHVHLHVDDLSKSIVFYSRLFAAEPARVERDYAKWMLEDPRVNFAISTVGHGTGIDHLGIQATTKTSWLNSRSVPSSPTGRSSMKGKPSAAMRRATSTGSPIRKVLPGSITAPLKPPWCTARAAGKAPPLAAQSLQVRVALGLLASSPSPWWSPRIKPAAESFL